MRTISSLVLALCLAIALVSGFANTFLDDKTMSLNKGETGEFCIFLQNTGEEDNMQVINIVSGGEFIRNLNDVNKDFLVPVGTVSDDMPICMEVVLPSHSVVGQKYKVEFGVSGKSTDDEPGMAKFAPLQIKDHFFVTEKELVAEVVPVEVDRGGLPWYYFAIMGGLIVIGGFSRIMANKNKHKKSKAKVKEVPREEYREPYKEPIYHEPFNEPNIGLEDPTFRR